MTQEEREKQKRDDVKWVLSTQQGRRFVWDLLGACGLYRAQEGDSDSRTIQEGARRIGLHILGTITDADELLYVQMQLESRNRTLEEISNGNANRQPNTDADNFESYYNADGHDSGAFDSELPIYDSGTTLDSFI